MSGILTLIAQIFSSAFGKALADIFSAWRAEQSARQLGAAQQTTVLDQAIAEVVDARIDVANDSAHDAGALAERLRKRANSGHNQPVKL